MVPHWASPTLHTGTSLLVFHAKMAFATWCTTRRGRRKRARRCSSRYHGSEARPGHGHATPGRGWTVSLLHTYLGKFWRIQLDAISWLLGCQNASFGVILVRERRLLGGSGPLPLFLPCRAEAPPPQRRLQQTSFHASSVPHDCGLSSNFQDFPKRRFSQPAT